MDSGPGRLRPQGEDGERPGPLPVTAAAAGGAGPRPVEELHACPARSLLSLDPASEGLVLVTEVSEL